MTVRTYSYKHAPTIKKFSEDNTFIRAIMGPFGCLSADTEFLTPTGWKRIDRYSNEQIGEYNLVSGRVEFRYPQDYTKLPCVSFIHLKNRYGIDQLLSDEHTVLFSTRFQPDRWQTITALELFNKHNSLKDGWSGLIPTVFGAPDMPGVDLSDDELRLMVAVQADSSLKRDSCTICVRRERKKKRLRFLLMACGIEWNERNYPGRPTETSFDFIPPEHHKELFRYYSAAEHQLAIIADEVVHWDGCTDKYGGIIYCSTNRENADFVQYAFATTGKRSTVTEVVYDNANWNNGYRVYVGTGATDLSLRQAPKLQRVQPEDGHKYCFKTSTGFFVARRNGRMFITGNSGKSSGCVVEIYKRAIAQAPDTDGVRRTKFAIVRNSFPQLHDTTIPSFLYWLGHLGTQKIADHDFIMDKVTAPDGSPVHCLVHFRALDKPEDIKNLLSLELTGSWFNESREINRGIVNAMRGRVGRYPPRNPDGTGGPTWKGIWLDTNPPDVDHWMFKLFEEDRPQACLTCRRGPNNDQMVLYPSRRRDNSVIPIEERRCPVCNKDVSNSFPLTAIYKQPSGFSREAENLPFLEPDYYALLAAGMDKDFVDVYVHGLYGYVRDGKPVYDNWDSSFHLAKDALRAARNIPLILAFDNTGLKQGCVAMQYMPTGQLRILHEWLIEGMGTRRLCQEIVRPYVWSNYPGIELFITGDPAGVRRSDTDERTTFQEINEAFGVAAIPARTNSWGGRYNAVDSFLTRRIGKGEPALLVSTECKMTFRGFQGEYRMKRLQVVGGEKYVDRPEKNLVSNIHDAIQYGALFTEEMVNVTIQNRNAERLAAASAGAVANNPWDAWT